MEQVIDFIMNSYIGGWIFLGIFFGVLLILYFTSKYDHDRQIMTGYLSQIEYTQGKIMDLLEEIKEETIERGKG